MSFSYLVMNLFMTYVSGLIIGLAIIKIILIRIEIIISFLE